MKLILFIDGQKTDIMNLDLVYNNVLQYQELLINAVQKIKLENRLLISAADSWQLYLQRESRMNTERVK